MPRESFHLKTVKSSKRQDISEDLLCTDPSEVQVSVEEAAAQRGDPGEDGPPLYVVSHSPGGGAGPSIKYLRAISLCSIMYL